MSEKGVFFIMLPRDVVRSEQGQALSPKAGWLLVGLFDRYNGRNNGEIVFSARQAKEWLKCSSMTAHRAFDELEHAGFIEAVERGSFDVKSGRGRATTWRLTFV